MNFTEQDAMRWKKLTNFFRKHIKFILIIFYLMYLMATLLWPFFATRMFIGLSVILGAFVFFIIYFWEGKGNTHNFKDTLAKACSPKKSDDLFQSIKRVITIDADVDIVDEVRFGVVLLGALFVLLGTALLNPKTHSYFMTKEYSATVTDISSAQTNETTSNLAADSSFVTAAPNDTVVPTTIASPPTLSVMVEGTSTAVSGIQQNSVITSNLQPTLTPHLLPTPTVTLSSHLEIENITPTNIALPSSTNVLRPTISPTPTMRVIFGQSLPSPKPKVTATAIPIISPSERAKNDLPPIVILGITQEENLPPKLLLANFGYTTSMASWKLYFDRQLVCIFGEYIFWPHTILAINLSMNVTRTTDDNSIIMSCEQVETDIEEEFRIIKLVDHSGYEIDRYVNNQNINKQIR